MRLDQFKAQTAALGIQVIQTGRRESKADYLAALRKYQLRQDYPSGLPYQELSPMLCFPYWDLHPKEQRELWRDRNGWLAQEKLNGCRVILHFIEGVGVFAHSRSINKSDYRRTEFSDRLLFHNYLPTFTATVDCEATSTDLQTAVALLRMNPTESRQTQRERVPLTFHAFDIPVWQGEDLRQYPLKERLAFLSRFRTKTVSAGLGKHFLFPIMLDSDKEFFFEQITKLGGEGVVLKWENSPYIDSTARDRNAWVKVKKSISFDAYCSGFERGNQNTKWSDYVACLLFSVATESGERLIAKISNLKWDFRRRISLYDRSTGNLNIEPKILGRVARVTGQEFSHRAFRLTHPTISHWRPDLEKEHCKYRASELRSLREGNSGNPVMRVTLKPR